MTYDEYVAALQFLTASQDANGQALLNEILPQVISYAELRLYRQPLLDFLSTRTTDISQHTTAGIRSVPIPTQFVVVENVALITPANTLPTDPGAERVPLFRTTRSMLDTTWPVESLTQPPAMFETYWAMFSQEEALEGDDPAPMPSAFLIAPTVDDVYRVEVTGTFRPAPLSPTNPTTFITTDLPDLFISASMVFMCGVQKNFGAAADDPRSSLYWEALLKEQLSSAEVEEARKKAQSVGQTPYAPTPLASAGRNVPAPMMQPPPP